MNTLAVSNGTFDGTKKWIAITKVRREFLKIEQNFDGSIEYYGKVLLVD